MLQLKGSDRMKLSVIVPVYNMASNGKLHYCLDSLLHQTQKDMEIIVVDDCSTDESLFIMKQYEKENPTRVKVFANEVNKKQGGARNLGLANACGTWIGFVDSDDWVAPTMYEKLINKAQETGADVVACDYHIVEKHTMEIGKIVPNNSQEQTGILQEEQYKKLVMRPGSMVIKIYLREVIVNHNLNFPEHIFYEDNCAAPIWMLHFTHFEKLDEPFYYYYQLDESTVHQVNTQKCLDRMTAGKMMIDLAKEKGYLETYYNEFEFRFTELYYVNTLFTYVIGITNPKVSFLRKLAKGMKTEFPDFEKNEYYQKTFDEEQKRLVGYHMKSSLFFLMYYKALSWYRKWKYKR